MSPWGKVKRGVDRVGEGDSARYVFIRSCIVCEGRVLAFEDDTSPACETHSYAEQAKARAS